MDLEFLNKKNKKDIVNIAKSLNIKGYSSKNKDELINLITNIYNPVPKEEINIERFDIQNIEGLKYLQTIENSSVNLILTDPPYIISKDSGMNEHYNNIKNNEDNEIEYSK
jgi:hypothetical protein